MNSGTVLAGNDGMHHHNTGRTQPRLTSGRRATEIIPLVGWDQERRRRPLDSRVQDHRDPRLTQRACSAFAGPVLAAGGIVVRETPEPMIAVVRLRKDKSWVLPKGKLKLGEDASVGARREVM